MTEHPTAPDFLVRFFLNITRDEVGSGGVGSWYEHTHFIEPTRTFWFLQAWWYFLVWSHSFLESMLRNLLN